MKKQSFAVALAVTALFAACKKDASGPNTQTYRLPANATAHWKGYLVTGYFNEGTIAVESSSLQLTDGRVTGGTFRMPLSSIQNLNLPTDSLRQLLVHHLQSADFFNMALHPELSFTIKSIQPYAGGSNEAVDSANYWVNGDLSLLGKALPVSFPAAIQTGNDRVGLVGRLKVDRTRWGINYASDPGLPDEQHIINDISIDFRFAAVKN